MGERIIDYPEAETLANDDYILLDGIRGGSKKILASELGSGGGGSIEIKQILDNSAWASPTTYELTESVYNFDFIIFVCAYNFGGNQVTCSNILPSDYLTIRQDGMANWHYIQLQCWEHMTYFGMNNPSASGGAGDKIDYISDTGSRGILRNIYGVKFSTT